MPKCPAFGRFTVPGISLASLDFLISSLVIVVFLMQLESTVKLHSDKVGLARRE